MTHTAKGPIDSPSFESVISAWGSQPQCEMATHNGNQCRRPAHWRLNLHGCEAAISCGQHLRMWTREAATNSSGRCAHCGRTFDQITDSYTVTPL